MKRKSAKARKAPRKKARPSAEMEILEPRQLDEALERDQLLAELETLRAAQLDIEHSQQLYVELFEQAPIGYVNLTPAGRIQNANFAAATVLRLEQPFLIDSPFRSFIHPDDQLAYTRHLLRCERAGDSDVVSELRLRNPKVNPRWIELLSRQATVFGSTDVIYRTVIREITESKQATIALRESEARLRAIVEQSNVGVARADLKGRLTFANKQLAEMLGYPVEALEGVQCRQLMHPADREHHWKRFGQLLKDGLPFQLNERMIRKDGNFIWVSLHVSTLLDEAGRPQSAAAVVIDISEQKEAEEALKQSEEQFRRAIEEAPIPVIMHAEDGKVLEISKTWTKLTGYRRADMPSFEAWLNRAYGYGAEAVREEMQRIFGGQDSRVQLEFEIKAREGAIRNWLFNASPVGTLSDGRRFIVGMALDITERKQAESALAKNREQLQLIVENAREYAIFSTDLNRKVTSWNLGAERLLGYKEEQIVGRSADLIFTPEDRKAGEPLKEARTAESIGRAIDERWHVRKDETRFWGSGVTMPMHDATGKTIGLVKIFRDDTEARETREALEHNREELWRALQEARQARAAAEEADRAKDHFLAVLSHELRTPLSPVLMASHVLLRRKDLPDDVRDALVTIQRNVRVEARLVDDLLDVTRIARGKLHLNRASIHLHDVIHQAVEICRPDIQAKNQRLSVTYSAENDRIDGDSARLQQVIWNLLKNASKFTPERGRISVRTRNKNDYFIVDISDTGIGLDESAIEKVFRPFVQADQGITQTYGGLGLGLAIAKAATEAHEGHLEARSKGLGKGCTMTISLPVSMADNA